jgi:hypothetical protein
MLRLQKQQTSPASDQAAMDTKKQATLDLTGRKAGKADIDDAVSALRRKTPGRLAVA